MQRRQVQLAGMTGPVQRQMQFAQHATGHRMNCLEVSLGLKFVQGDHGSDEITPMDSRPGIFVYLRCSLLDAMFLAA